MIIYCSGEVTDFEIGCGTALLSVDAT